MKAIKQPVFLLCGERSGSNLIRTIMNSHSQVLAPMPLHWVRLVWSQSHLYGDLDVDENWTRFLEHTSLILRDQVGDMGVKPSVEELTRDVEVRTPKGVFEYVYGKALELSGKERLFLKEIRTDRFLPVLIANFPDAKFVYQVRDPRDVTLSMMKLPLHGGLLWATRNIAEEHEVLLSAYCSMPKDRIFAHRYEDLVDDPERTIRALCAFIDVPYEPTMLDFHKTKEAAIAAKRSVGWKNLAKPLMKGNHGKFREGLTPRQIAMVEDAAQHLMGAFGYEPEGPKLDATAKFIVRASKLPRVGKMLDKRLSLNNQTVDKKEKDTRSAFYRTLDKIRANRREVGTPRAPLRY